MPPQNLCAGLVLAVALSPVSAFAHSNAVPLGDGNVSSSPKRDNVFACQTRFKSRPGAAAPSGPWIKGDVWYPDQKPFLAGNVTYNGGGLTVTTQGATRRLSGKSLPNHGTGAFPIDRSDPLYQYDRNPNGISAQSITFDLPANPSVAASPSCLPMGPIGVALTGALIYNALDAIGLDAAAHEIQDKCNGHPQGRGQYHYHSASDCMEELGKGTDGHSGLVAYALDGFGIYGMAGAGGTHLSNADLDACHGHTETVMWDGKSVQMYHYHLTDEYPYTLGCFAGTAVRR
ncbi:YHYH protein [Pseudorhodobacter ferrugineus]|uniref:YHYH protein n=1 Tax=Pseudorhodobacter ferrugineus TaxID=77008 RepID=UPI0009DB85DC|nr:YHYH protein [Pseudorhodobacter ferrugineus]